MRILCFTIIFSFQFVQFVVEFWFMCSTQRQHNNALIHLENFVSSCSVFATHLHVQQIRFNGTTSEATFLNILIKLSYMYHVYNACVQTDSSKFFCINTILSFLFCHRSQLGNIANATFHWNCVETFVHFNIICCGWLGGSSPIYVSTYELWSKRKRCENTKTNEPMNSASISLYHLYIIWEFLCKELDFSQSMSRALLSAFRMIFEFLNYAGGRCIVFSSRNVICCCFSIHLYFKFTSIGCYDGSRTYLLATFYSLIILRKIFLHYATPATYKTFSFELFSKI